MMKKLLIALLALGTLSFVPSAEANRCHKSCEPECTTDVQKQYVYEPCTKTVEIAGKCKHEICTTRTTCTKKSKRCVGPCEGGCPTGVTAADRGENRGENGSSSSKRSSSKANSKAMADEE